MLKFIIKYLILSLIVIFTMLLAVSLFTLLERKVLGGIQRRHGPIFTGYFGLLQPFADGLKLFLKEISIPAGGYYYVFLASSMLSLTLSLLSWSVIPFSSKFVIADLNFGMLFLLFISSLNVYATLFSGWASNSKYGLLGSIRSGAQMISYELPMTLSLLPIALYASSFNLTNIAIFQQENFWFIFFIPSAYVYFTTALAETNRTPFDLPEAESELVAGYNIEYSSLPFAFFFLAEYNHMLVMSFLFAILFLGGWSNFFTFFMTEETFAAFYSEFFADFLEIDFIHCFIPTSTTYDLFKYLFFGSNETIETSILVIKAIFVVLLFISVRAVVPRYKYIQLIKLCWSVFIPLLLYYVTLVMYAYGGAVYVNQYVERDWRTQETAEMIQEIYENMTLDDCLTMQFVEHVEKYNTSPDGTVDLSINREWLNTGRIDDVWLDSRFMKYLTVKYYYIYTCDNPLQALVDEISDPTSKDSSAYDYVMDYYSDGDYFIIFEPNHLWYKNFVATLGLEPLPEKELTDERLLELYFGLRKGDLKPHPENCAGYARVPDDRYYAPIDYDNVASIASNSSIPVKKNTPNICDTGICDTGICDTGICNTDDITINANNIESVILTTMHSQYYEVLGKRDSRTGEEILTFIIEKAVGNPDIDDSDPKVHDFLRHIKEFNIRSDNGSVDLSLNNRAWLETAFIDNIWSEDSRFMKYLMVKYKFINHHTDPLAALLTEIKDHKENNSVAYDFILDYYSGGEYYTIFEPTRMWYEYYERYLDFPLLEDDVTDERLLELYFGLNEGDLKPHPETSGGYEQVLDASYEPLKRPGSIVNNNNDVNETLPPTVDVLYASILGERDLHQGEKNLGLMMEQYKAQASTRLSCDWRDSRGE